MSDLFDDVSAFEPLAEKMRPKNLEDFVGQEEIIGPFSSLRKMIEGDVVTSMIFWGPPGVGKTTLAHIIAQKTNSSFHELSAVTSGIKEIKEIMEIAKFNKSCGQKTILFVDEIHRFNKAQQDAFLPYVERGDIILIGATTENPSFEVNSALLSRSKVYVLKSLCEEDIIKVLKRAVHEIYPSVVLEASCYSIIAGISNGDARTALNTLENVLNTTNLKKNKKITEKDLQKVIQSKTFLYDKKGEEHYNLISALHKSIRNSDPSAALYYLARMLEAGEDPLYVARRLVRFASEDVGMANTNALVQAVSTYQAVTFLGMPECNVNLAQLVVYLSACPKSNSLYVAYETVKKDAIATAQVKVPLHLRNAVTHLDEELGYGKGYQYAHDFEEHVTNMQCLPDALKDKIYYFPSNSGNEKNVKQIFEKIEKRKKQ